MIEFFSDGKVTVFDSFWLPYGNLCFSFTSLKAYRWIAETNSIYIGKWVWKKLRK